MENEGKIRGCSSDQKRTFLMLCVIQIFAFGLILLTCNVKYEVSDDFIMEMILSGTYTGECDVHIMFSNVMWASLLVPFYKIVPAVSWYLLAQLLVCLLSYIAISYVFSRALSWKDALLSALLITVFTAMDVYILPQFTKTAAIAVISGAMLFLWTLYHDESWYPALIGGVLLLVGSWIRFDAIYIAAPFVGFVLFYETAVCLMRNKITIKMLLRVFVPGCVLIAAVFGSMFLNGLIYERNDEYMLFKEYRSVRSSIVDYRLPEYEECAEEFVAIGISENDYQMIVNWSFGDSEVFGLDKMRQVEQVLQRYRADYTQSLWQMLFGAVRRKQVFYPGAICCIILGLWCILRDKRKFWMPVGLALLILSFLVYFSAVGRNVYRVEFGFFLCAAVCLGLYLPDQSAGQSSAGKWTLCGLSIVLVINQLSCYIPDRSYQNLDQEEYRAVVDDTFYASWDYSPDKYGTVVRPGQIRPDFLKEVDENPQNLYVLDFNTAIQTLYYDFSPFESAASVFPENLAYLGGVLVNHPSARIGDRSNADLLDLLLEEHVYFVSNGTEEPVLRFFREHGYPETKMELYDTLDGYRIWKYSTGQQHEFVSKHE